MVLKFTNNLNCGEGLSNEKYITDISDWVVFVVALMGTARGYYTFMSHLKWTWAIAIGYIASVYAHLWINAASF